ncbi:MAG: hypothetical protein J6A82_01340 [Coprococcus sp.]|nr:hypothetical protein [Coprococcus sp.]
MKNNNKDEAPIKKKNKIFSNIGLKLISVALGFLVWLIVLNIDDSAVTKTISSIPVSLINTDALTSKSQLYTITSGDTVDIVVKGRKSLISDLDASDFKAVADMAKISITNAVPITVTANSSNIAKKVSITVMNNVMLVELETEKTASVSVSVVTKGEVEKGYTIGNSVAAPNLITIKGAASVVSSIDRAEVVVDVSGAKDDIMTNCVPEFVTVEGEHVSDKTLTYDAETIAVTVPIYKTKNIPISISTVGSPAEGYSVSGITYVPETIDIGGDLAIIRDISRVSINDIDVSGCTSDVETTIDVSKYLPEGVVVTKDSMYINVKITIEKNVTRSIALTPGDITINNKQDEYDYEIIIGDESNIAISGISSAVSKITAKKLALVIDASKLYLGENTVVLSVADGKDYTVTNECTVIVNVTEKE